MKQHISLFLAFLICSTLNAQKDPHGQDKLIQSCDKVMDSIAKNNPLPTFIVGGLTKNGFFYQYHHGNKLWEGKEPISKNHIFRIYSMTKAVTSLAAMQLVERGKITLDEPLDKLMPEMAEIPILTKEGKLVKATISITLRQLLTHTAGFAYPFLHNGLNKFQKPADWKYQDFPRVYEAAGTVYWSGAACTFYSIDRKNGKAVLFFSNVIPWSNPYTELAYMKSESILYGTKQ